MDKQMAIWLTCLIAKDLEKNGHSLASTTCEAIEEKLIKGKHEEVFNFIKECYKKESSKSCIEIRLFNQQSNESFYKMLTIKEMYELKEIIDIKWRVNK